MGISINVPAHGVFFEEDNSSATIEGRMRYKELEFRFHPVILGYFNEPVYLIEMSVVRISKTNVNSFLNNEHFLFKSYDSFYEDRIVFYSNVTVKVKTVAGAGRRQNEGKSDYAVMIRKDLIASNGDIILCGASLYAGGDAYVNPQDDIGAISNMIQSIRVIW